MEFVIFRLVLLIKNPVAMNFRFCFTVPIILIVCANYSNAAFEKFTIGARQIALGGSYTALAHTAFGQYQNPAGLSLSQTRHVEFFYSQPFGFEELKQQSIAYSDPYLIQPYGALGLGLIAYGFELYKELRLQATFSSALHSKIHYGVSIKYNSLSIKNYGSTECIAFDLGLLALLLPNLTTGFSVFNINEPRIGSTDDALPLTYQLGLAYMLNTQARVLLDVEYDPEFELSLKSGLEYDPVDYFTIRLGFSNEPSQFSGGFGFHYSILDLDYGVSSHKDLGLSHALTLGFRFGKKSSSKPGYIQDQHRFQEELSLAFGQKRRLPLQLNTASAEELQTLPGITKQVVSNILQYRNDYGKFLSLEELLDVKGVNEAWYNKVVNLLTLE